MGRAIKHPVPANPNDWVKPSFVIFDIQAHRMLYGCTHIATVDIKGLKSNQV